MEVIAIEGQYWKTGAPNIPAFFYKVHNGPSPHVRIIGGLYKGIGGHPMTLEDAILDELRERPGYAFKLQSFQVFDSDGVHLRENLNF
ncbi:MAG TPA: hypothetical protein VEI26_17940 [Terriglobales bacterium]|nr:hypothetical protein [Terriglobales bacterium]